MQACLQSLPSRSLSSAKILNNRQTTKFRRSRIVRNARSHRTKRSLTSNETRVRFERDESAFRTLRVDLACGFARPSRRYRETIVAYWHRYCFLASASTSRRDFDFMTSHTPLKTSATARACFHVKTHMPHAMLTLTDTTGCT